MTQNSYLNSNQFTEKDETDRIIPRQFHNQSPEGKTKQILDAAKTVVEQRYPSITESDISELAEIRDELILHEDTPEYEDIRFLVDLANRALKENEKLKNDLIGFAVVQMERHVQIDQITKNLSRPNPIATSLARGY